MVDFISNLMGMILKAASPQFSQCLPIQMSFYTTSVRIVPVDMKRFCSTYFWSEHAFLGCILLFMPQCIYLHKNIDVFYSHTYVDTYQSKKQLEEVNLIVPSGFLEAWRKSLLQG